MTPATRSATAASYTSLLPACRERRQWCGPGVGASCALRRDVGGTAVSKAAAEALPGS
jgi:hypothetical protein